MAGARCCRARPIHHHPGTAGILRVPHSCMSAVFWSSDSGFQEPLTRDIQGHISCRTGHCLADQGVRGGSRTGNGCTYGARTGKPGDRASSAWRVLSCGPGFPGETERRDWRFFDPTLTLRVGATVVEPTAAAGAQLDTQHCHDDHVFRAEARRNV